MKTEAQKSNQRLPAAKTLWQHPDWSILALILSLKLLVLFFGGLAATIFLNRAPAGIYGWLAIWNQWDSPHYLDIARNGYMTTGDQKPWIVFFPLFPWTTRLFAIVLRNYLLAAFAVSTVASVGAGLLLRRLAEIDLGKEIARNAVWFMFIFPTAYFFHIGYTESLFLFFALGSFLAARRDNWWLAGVLGAFASLTRLNGVLLIPALACEAFIQYRAKENPRLRVAWLWIAFIGVGIALYLLINWRIHGEPLAFLTFQRDRFFKVPAWPWVGIIKVWTWEWPDVRHGLMNGPVEFIFIWLTLAFTIWAWTLRRSYGVWMGLNWLLFTSTSMVNSIPRYSLILFPIYLLLARFSNARPVWSAIITTGSLMFMTLLISLFVQGEWAY